MRLTSRFFPLVLALPFAAMVGCSSSPSTGTDIPDGATSDDASTAGDGPALDGGGAQDGGALKDGATTGDSAVTDGATAADGGGDGGTVDANVPCGEAAGAKCADGRTCAKDADCTSDWCNAGNVCEAVGPAAHVDGRQNAGETGIDCGGTALPKLCVGGQACVDDGDCEGSCVQNTCTPGTRTDGKLTASLGETDIDCGGALADVNEVAAAACIAGQKCLAATDCRSGECDANGLCTGFLPGVKDGDETDVDCGGALVNPDTGAVAPRCDDQKSCADDGDCKSALCNLRTMKCTAGVSCKNRANGGETCGVGEDGAEDCCESLPLPGTPNVRLDRYEVTAGRVRAFVNAVGPNIRAWVAAQIAADPDGKLAKQLPPRLRTLLPATASGELGANIQLGALTMDTDRPSEQGSLQGCYIGSGAYGHSTYGFDTATYKSLYGAGNFSARISQNETDKKSMNCAPYWMAAAFCAWDGGFLPTYEEYIQVWARKPNNSLQTFPWGADAVGKVFDYLNAKGIQAGNAPIYNFPIFNWANDQAGLIASPGRFPDDATTITSADGRAWYDIGANMMEYTAIELDYARYGVAGWPAAGFDVDAANAPRAFCDVTAATPPVGSPDRCAVVSGNTTTYGKIRGAGAGTPEDPYGMYRTRWMGGSWEVHAPSTRWIATQTQYGKAGWRCARPAN